MADDLAGSFLDILSKLDAKAMFVSLGLNLTGQNLFHVSTHLDDLELDLRASRLDFEASWPLFWSLQALFSRLPGLILVALGLILQLP